jgi:hypothetical protein
VKSSCECVNEHPGFYKVLGNPLVVAHLVVSRVVLSSIELVIWKSEIFFS